MTDRPSCYPSPATAPLPLLDVLTSPVPSGRFDSPVDERHVLCLHLGGPVPVSYRAGKAERQGMRLHGQFCVVPGGSSTRWTLSRPATSLLLRLAPAHLRATADDMGRGARAFDLAPAIHVRDPQIERIGWMMQAEDHDAHPGGRLFADSLASALAVRLVALQSPSRIAPARALPAWRLRHVIDYIDAHLDQDLTLAELAAVAGFSPSHFKALFRQATGTPVHRFVLERRVERARLHLLEGRLSVTEVALETGFAHPSHMARWMRRLLGLSPSQVRAS
ncbi:AraC family transcriptional regulator [Massilia sp. Root133]|uniref:Helix-turn-helix domain-containing protein n=1 Tax=Massilia cellulosiltytica TaxID=2683234 RepID=A0A7X3FUY4_9BURK|nr:MULTISPECIES: helix-turn-helix domain-containing protein [Telluria group]KQY08725.1 AraC family transcriptional regulator [Massilia sp. Root133]KQZ54321.1 AraC family transcriptional regulator [Massilia sp. Root1485]MVW58330.1 helix-turn-helix domain-containing protein [Telluria cellulosilytica]